MKKKSLTEGTVCLLDTVDFSEKLFEAEMTNVEKVASSTKTSLVLSWSNIEWDLNSPFQCPGTNRAQARRAAAEQFVIYRSSFSCTVRPLIVGNWSLVPLFTPHFPSTLEDYCKRTQADGKLSRQLYWIISCGPTKSKKSFSPPCTVDFSLIFVFTVQNMSRQNCQR